MIKRPESPDEMGLILPQFVALAPEGDFIEIFKSNTEEVLNFFENIPEEKWIFSYAPGKWNIGQILQHLCDVERVMVFRAFVAARGNADTNLPGMDENAYAANVDISVKTKSDLISEFKVVREHSYSVFQFMTEEESKRTVQVYYKPVSARTFAYMILGHALHHLRIISEKYLPF